MSESMSRTLRSEYLRHLLFQRSGGLCAKCGSRLGEVWHADHVIPWSVSKRTNVFEMQALCPACNLKKGSKMEDRRHQLEATGLALRIVSGERTKKETIADATPGSGKSRLITNYAKVLHSSGKVTHTIVGCPRKALVQQMEKSWVDAGLPKDQATVTHYQDIATRWKTTELIQRCRHENVLFVADELQFLHDFHESANGLWDTKAQELFANSKYFLGVSGTLMSSRPGKLLGVSYLAKDEMQQKHPGEAFGEMRSNQVYPHPDISYNLRQALQDKVVAPYQIDQTAITFKPIGVDREFELFSGESEEYQGLLKEILHRQECWQPILDKMVEQWKAYRQVSYFSNAIVIAASQEHAKEIEKYLSKRHGCQVHLAVSDQGEHAYIRINDLKRNKFDRRPRVLVTVAMASVGLDIPQATHMAYLSPYRFFGWMLQAWARVSRICYDSGLPVHEQIAYVYTVDDLRMQKFVDWIKVQDPKGLRSEKDTVPPSPPPPPPPLEDELDSCRVTGVSFESSDIDDKITGADAEQIEQIIKADPRVATLKRRDIQLVVRAHQNAKAGKVLKMKHERKPEAAPADRKKALKLGVNAIQRFVCKSTGRDSQEVWVAIKNDCGLSYKSLPEMAVSELHSVMRSAFTYAMSIDNSTSVFYIKYSGSKNVCDEAKEDHYLDMAEIATDEARSLGLDVSFSTRKQR